MNLCFFFAYFAPVKTKGCPQRGAEIIPEEPEAVSTDVGIVFLSYRLSI